MMSLTSSVPWQVYILIHPSFPLVVLLGIFPDCRGMFPDYLLGVHPHHLLHGPPGQHSFQMKTITVTERNKSHNLNNSSGRCYIWDIIYAFQHSYQRREAMLLWRHWYKNIVNLNSNIICWDQGSIEDGKYISSHFSHSSLSLPLLRVSLFSIFLPSSLTTCTLPYRHIFYIHNPGHSP